MATPLDLAELLAATAARSSRHPALVQPGGRTLTWGELDEEVSRVATGLGDLGVVAGRRVLLCLPNRIELVVAYLAVLRAQAVAVPVHPRAPVAELAWMREHAGARVLVGDATTSAGLREVAAGAGAATRLVLVGEEPAPTSGSDEISYDVLSTAAARAVPPLPDPEKLAALLYTSGTSGEPQAAMLTHRALLANVEQVAGVQPAMIGPDDVVYGVLPLFHVYGLNAVLGSVVRQGATLVVADGFDPAGSLATIREHGCTVLPVAPPVFRHWLPQPGLAETLQGVRMVLSGSATLPPEQAAEFTRITGLDVHQGYGLTEAAPVVTSTLLSEHPRPGSLGVPLPGVEVQVVDDDGRLADDADPGRIQIRGDNLFSGYWPDAEDAPNAEGWWCTGDLGFLDSDGELFLVDRLKDLVVVSGFNVYPHEVEAVIAGVDGVVRTAVIGVPDDDTGESVVAYVLAPGQDPDAVREAVQQRCADRLARFKRPGRVEVVEELPGTLTGRVRRERLRGIERRRALGLIDE